MAERATVLVIDDDEIVLLAMTDLLEEAGMKVITRNSPIGVTRVISDENVSVIVIDINMPIMQGDAVIRLLRSWDKFRDVPVVIVSGIASKELAEVKQRVGDVPIVHKKSLQTDLVPVVSRCLIARAASGSASRASDADGAGEPFLKELSAAMETLRKLWSEFSSGRSADKRPLQQEIRRLLSRAQLVGLNDVAGVLTALEGTIMNPLLRPTPAISHAIQLCIRALEDAGRKDGKLAISCQGLVDGLARAREAS